MLADVRSKRWSTISLAVARFRNIRMSPRSECLSGLRQNLRHAFEQETELFVESDPRGSQRGGPADGRLAFVNERLAKHYGIPNVVSDRFPARPHQRSGACGHSGSEASWR